MNNVRTHKFAHSEGSDEFAHMRSLFTQYDTVPFGTESYFILHSLPALDHYNLYFIYSYMFKDELRQIRII